MPQISNLNSPSVTDPTLGLTASSALSSASHETQAIRFDSLTAAVFAPHGNFRTLWDENARAEQAAKRKMPAIPSHTIEGGPSKKKKKSRHHGRLSRASTACPAPFSTRTQIDEDVRDNEVGEEQQQQDWYNQEPGETITLLVKQLRNACDEIANLQSALKQIVADSDARHMRVRQDMLFDAVLAKDKAEKKLQHERYRWYKITTIAKAELEKKIKELQSTMDEMKKAHDAESRSNRETMSRQSAQLAGERNRYLRKVSEVSVMQSELDHCRTLLRSADEDLAELQRIDNEENVAREKRNRGLPPAYGSLDDVEYLPSYGRHEDGGKLEVATIKHTVRDRFVRDLSRAQNSSNSLRESPTTTVRDTAGQELFHLATTALAEACWSMNAILNTAEDVRTPESKSHKPQRSHVSKRAFIANRIAKLIIDFCWKILACFDVRPLEVHLSARVKAETGKYIRAADDVLLKSLEIAILNGKERIDDALLAFAQEDDPCIRCHNACCAGHCERMNELQYFLTLVKAVSHRFDKLTGKDLAIPPFTETYTWLTENVETERRLAANAQLPPTRQMSPAEEEALAVAAAAAVTAGTSICPQMNPPEIMADVQARLNLWRTETTAAPSNRDPWPAILRSNRNIMAMPSHYLTSTIENLEAGTAVPAIMVRSRGADGGAEGDMFAVELGMLDETIHVLVSQDAWNNS